jgi:hypothetical protein
MVGWTEFEGFHTVRDTIDTVTAHRLEMVGRLATQTILELAATN